MELAIVRSNDQQSPAASRPEMEPEIWHKLPIELLDRVLSFLPLKNFMSLRPTNRHFRSLIFSRNFHSKHANSLSPSPISSFLLLSHPQLGRYLLYDTVLNTWRDVDLHLTHPVTFTPLLCTATCLLCFSAVPDSSNSAFLLHNLLQRATRFIRFPKRPFAFESPTLITNSTGYHLFCMSQIYAYVYDSRNQEWSRYDGFNRTLGDSEHQKGVFLDGSLYFTTRDPFSVVNFDLETGKWETLDVEMPERLTFVRLAAGSGNINGEKKLFMFGGIGWEGHPSIMKVWELDVKGRKWMEIECVTQLMGRKLGSLCNYHYEDIYCFWHQGMICVCFYTWPEVICFKVATRTWHVVPRAPSLPKKWIAGFQWFPFAPELYAKV